MSASQLLVTGATGATGYAAVKALQGSGNSVRALVHQDDRRVERLRTMGAEIVLGDLLDIDSVRSALDGVDAAYFVYPIKPRLIDATAYFAQAAEEAGVQAIVNLSQRTSHRHSKSHAAQNHWIAERVFDWSAVPTTHLRPTLFAEWILYPFVLQRITDNDVLALPFGSGRFAPIAALDQGRAIAAVLSNPGAHAGRTYLLNGPAVLDGEEIAAGLSEALGRSIRYVPLPIEEYQAAAAAVPQLADFFAQHIGAVVAELTQGLLSATNNTVEELTGIAPMSIQDFARAHSDVLASSKTAGASA
ncbi:NmrA family NAD(P)-binding protein [Mycobacterium sp. Aquia_216]|uniref:NmrA family NAD(P)-binding protein n=1 Tax=Mycobacterium sp. Aquia_216 TaxID=2991729 RepID=UPI00227AF6A9|nr:NmrA family NAD(P)-binding protein [Mycobacterium sp. Aquia_216]WAJ44302.1 NmrA family NAD(P)-binding protein [Mycobacterium sp. Aquia_216]